MNNRTLSGFLDGWGVLYQVRTFFVIILVVAMVINIAVFATAKFSNLVSYRSAIMPFMPAHPPTASAPAGITAPTTLPDRLGFLGTPREGNDVDPRSEKWEAFFSALLTMTGVITVAAAFFLVFCALLAVMMIVAGQLPGAGLITGAFFWAVLLVVLILPWCSFIPLVSCLPSVVAPFSAMKASIAGTQIPDANWIRQIPIWVQYVVYPIVVILIGIMYFGRFSQANSQIASIQPLPEQPVR